MLVYRIVIAASISIQRTPMPYFNSAPATSPSTKNKHRIPEQLQNKRRIKSEPTPKNVQSPSDPPNCSRCDPIIAKHLHFSHVRRYSRPAPQLSLSPTPGCPPPPGGSRQVPGKLNSTCINFYLPAPQHCSCARGPRLCRPKSTMIVRS